MSFISRLKAAEYICIISNECPKGGSVASVLHLKENFSQIEVISRDFRKSGFKIFLCLFFSKRIILNSLYLFNFLDVLLLCTLKKESLIYLHEGPSAIIAYKRKNKLKHLWFVFLIKRRKVACISLWQKNWLEREYRLSNNLFLQYNTLPLKQEMQFNITNIYILMVGYLMPRKGVSFFSELADYAVKQDGRLKFLWVGGGNAKGLYLSENVTWLGDKKHVDYYYQHSDLFFLASKDEPFGLVCAEALSYNKKCVVYKETGFYEVIKDLDGCSSYQEYNVLAAYAAINQALNSTINPEQVRKKLKGILDVDNFKRRLDKIFL